jgi:DMSO/TMAO reductase YedYZ molybdopterin-dependent catalytic subunit
MYAVRAAQGQASPALVIEGNVEQRLELRTADLGRMPRATLVWNSEGGQEITYEGVWLAELLRQAGASIGERFRAETLATYVIAEARDGYRAIFSLAELDPDFGNRKVLVADRADGRPLAQAGPVRLIVPDERRRGRSVRMLNRIRVVTLGKPAN